MTIYCGAIFGKPIKHHGFDWRTFGELAIQDKGRIKPISTFAIESMLLLSGKRSWGNLEPVEMILGFLFAQHEWIDEPFIEISSLSLKEALKLEKKRKYFSPHEISAVLNELASLEENLENKMAQGESLDNFGRSIQRLSNQYALFNSITSGHALTILPNPVGSESVWYSTDQLANPKELPYANEKIQSLLKCLQDLSIAYSEFNPSAWNVSSKELVGLIRNDLGKNVYPEITKIRLEVYYNIIRPFALAYGCYLVGLLFLFFQLIVKDRISIRLGLLLLVTGFLVHTFGFMIRILISGRAPVTNMYESVVWVSWGSILFSVLVWLFYRNIIILISATTFSVFALILADSVPTVLDSGIQPLEPVLRSNFWLTTHVLPITLSYASFAISMCLGNIILGTYIFRSRVNFTKDLPQYMYRTTQIGVLLLAVGTILGAVWADYSWGRFWGWDPKEVWALVTLLLYLAVLHARISKWLGEFGYVAATVLCFIGVIIAWYGVNFILGVGLHAYGFGSGGVGWITTFIAVQLVFVAFAYMRYLRFKLSSFK